MVDANATLLWVALGVIVATCGTTGALYTTIIKPTRKEHAKYEAERAEQLRISDAFIYGVKPIEGVTDGALSAPLRLQAVEHVMTNAVVELGKNTAEVKRMGEWQKEANGTARRTELALQEIATQVTTIAAAASASDLHEAVAAGIATHRQRIILEAIAAGEVHLPDQPLDT